MAKPSPIAPATESSPQTEAYAKQDVIDIPESDFREIIPPLPLSGPAEPVEDDSWFGNLFEDEDKSLKQQQIDAARALPSKGEFQSSWNLNKVSRDPVSTKIAAYQTHSTKPVDIAGVEEESGLEPIISFEKAVEGAGYVAGKVKDVYDWTPAPVQYTTDKVVQAGGAILSQLERLDVPRSESWTHGYKWAGRVLPDTDTWFGDAISDLSAMPFVGAAKLYEWDMGAPYPSSAFDSDKEEEEYYKDIEALGKNIYSAFADSKLYEKAIDQKGYFIDRPDLWGVLDGGNATGIDLLNIAFPIDMMKRLEANAPKHTPGGYGHLAGEIAELRAKLQAPGVDPKLKRIIERDIKAKETMKKWAGRSTAGIIAQLADPVSRMGWGLALEVVADPLWLLGAAKITQVVTFAGKVWNLGEAGTRVSGFLEGYSRVVGSGSRHQKRVVQAIVGTPEGANAARAEILDIADRAMMEATAARQEAGRFAKLAKDVKGGKVDDALAKLQAELADELDNLQIIAGVYSDVGAGLRTRRSYTMTQKKIKLVKEDIASLSSAKPQKIEDALLTKADHWADTASVHRSAASEMRSYVDLVRRSKPVAAGLVEKSKIPIFGTFHIPFRKSTYSMGTPGQIEAVAKKMNQALDGNDILASGVRSVKEGLDTLSEVAIARKITDAGRKGIDWFSSLSMGEKLAYGMRKVGHPMASMSYRAADQLAKMTLSRHWMPLVAAKGLSDEFAHYGARGAYMIGLTPQNSAFVRLKRLRPELWEAYQVSITNYMKQLALESGNAGLRIKVLYNLAGGRDGKGGALANWKKSIEKTEIPRLDGEIAELRAKLQEPGVDPKLKRTLEREIKAKETIKSERLEVLSAEYTVDDFMNEVARLVETGAGKIDDNPWLKSTVAKWNKIAEELSVKLQKPIEEVQQAMIAMARFGAGDTEASIAIARRIQVLHQLVEGAENVPSEAIVRMDQLTDAMAVRLKSRGKLLEVVSVNKLTEILYRTLDIAGETKFNQEIAQAIDNALMKALGGDREIADEILSYASAYYGRSPEESLRFLALEHSGEIQRIRRQIIAGDLSVTLPTPRRTQTVAAPVTLPNTPEFKSWRDGRPIVNLGDPLPVGPAIIPVFRGSGNKWASGSPYDSREGYAVFASSGPKTAMTYAGSEGGVAPMYAKVDEIIEFDKSAAYGGRYAGTNDFSRTKFDERAKRLRSGQALVVRNVADYMNEEEVRLIGLVLDDVELINDDIWAFGRGTEFKPQDFMAETQPVLDMSKAEDVKKLLSKPTTAPTAEPHKFVTDKLPFPPGTDHTTSIEELAHVIRNADREYAAFYDGTTGQLITLNVGKVDQVDPAKHLYNAQPKAVEDALQREQKLRPDQPPDEYFEKLTEIVATGDVIAIHNHPATLHESAIGHAFTAEGVERFSDLQGLKPILDDVISNVPPSIHDMKYTIAIDAKYHLVVNPDGTAWVIRRPKDGWPFVDEGTTNFRDRYEQVEIALNRVDDSNTIATKNVHDDLHSRYFDSDEGVLSDIEQMIDDLKDLQNAFEDGILTEKQYKILRQSKVNDWSSYSINKQFRELAEIELDVFQNHFGIKPFRINLPGRFKSKPAVLLGDTPDAAKIERGIIRNRIKASIQDAKLTTKATLNEIRDYRLNPRDDIKLLFSSNEAKAIVDARYVDSVDDFNRFTAKHDFLNENAEDALYDEIVRWVESDYPDGMDIPGVSRSADTWFLEKAEALQLPKTVSAKDIEAIRRSVIKVKRVEDQFRDRISVLTKASKRLERVEGPLTRGKIRKDAVKLRKQRTEEVLQKLLDDSPDLPTAQARIRAAFDDLLDLPDDPIYGRLKDELAETLSKHAYNRKKAYGIGPALKETRQAGRKLLKEELKVLQEELAETIPRLKIPDAKPGEDIIVHLKDWELEVWGEFKKVISGGALTEHEVMLVAFAALADSPKIFGGVGEDLHKAMKLRYKTLLGRRMEAIPEELKPVKEAFQSLIKHYEDLYVKHGMDFVKSPEDMLRLWGVIDYVPHVKMTAREITSGSPMTVQQGIRYFSDNLDKAFSTNINQRRLRTIKGSMAEINAATGGNLGIDPMNLTVRYMAAAKAISGQEFMYSLLAGGVLKSIGPKPVYESLLEKYANKYKLFLDIELDKVPPGTLESAVRAKANKTELTILDDALVNAADQIIPASQRAADMGYVPIFDRASPHLSNDLVINGSKTDWAKEGMLPEDIMEQFAEIASYSRKQREDKFAKYMRDSPAIRQADEIIGVVSYIKAKNFQAGQELYDPVGRFKQRLGDKMWELLHELNSKGKSADEVRVALVKAKPKVERDAWNAVATEMNKLMNTLGGSGRVQGGESLKTFYAQGEQMWSLYVPGVVRESMDELLIPKKFSKSWLPKEARRINNFWKIRVTIIAVAFHTRNFVSNQFSNMVDSGLATFSPSIAVDAGRLSSLSHVYDRYGSIEAARKVLGMPRGAAESAIRYRSRQAKLKIIDGLDIKNASYDLGDGIHRNADEALEILRERGVVAGGMQQFVDIDTFEHTLADIYVSAGLDKNLKRTQKLASAVEDGLIVSLPMLISGFPIPVGIPKGIGAGMGRAIENQARISNFIANVHKTKSFDKAAAHVDKFLFNYGDLTQTQKSWMRLLIPFFTWTQKNISLQMRMMHENPIFYANFQRLLIHQGPELVERYNAETLGIPYIPKWGASKSALALRAEHTRNYVRFPVPGKPGYYIEGLGLPQEAFFDQAQMFQQTAGLFKSTRFDKRKPHLRLMGQTHFMLKLAYESMLEKHSTFMDMPISEMTNGRVALETIHGYRKLPFIGPPIADALTEIAGITSVQPYNSKTGMFMDDVHIEGMPNYIMSNHPWSRITKDASAAALLYNMTYLDRMPSELRKEYLDAEHEPLPDVWKLLDAMGGLRIIATNEEASRARLAYDIKQRYAEAYKRAGITGAFPIETIKEQK